MTHASLTFRPPRKLVHALTALVAAGGVAVLAGLHLEPGRTGAGLLLVGFALTGMSLAGGVFVALLHVTGAGWATGLRRVPEAMAAAFPAGALLLAGVLLTGPELYPWFDPAAAEAENTTPLRAFWMDRTFFLLRALAYLACWYAFVLALVRASRRQDADGDPAHTRTSARLSAAFLVVFSVTFWLASQDWLMSLEAEWLADGTRRASNWSSTIYGLYSFSGAFLGGLAVLVLLVLWLRRVSLLGRIVGADALHDLGKLLFAMSTFWMYVWFCQYMLIWYVNNPEETTYFIQRQRGAWQPLLLADLALNWAVPFVVLLPQAAKRSPGVLARVCAALVLGRLLDLYLMIAPAVDGPAPAFGLLEVALALGGAGLFGLAFLRALSGAALVPVRDPYLVEGLPPAGPEGRAAAVLPRAEPAPRGMQVPAARALEETKP
jgi:hypothetical protein